MKTQEVINKASDQGIIINITDIGCWIDQFATDEQAERYINNGELPDNISFKDVLEAGKHLVAC